MMLLAIIAQFGTDNFTPSLPAIRQYFNITTALTQYTVTFYFIGLSTSVFFIASLSDVYGRKAILIFGYSIFVLGSVLCHYSPTIYWLLAGRFIQGAGAACGALFRSILRDSYSGHELSRVSSIVVMTVTLTPPLAPITGGYLEHFFGWRSNFILLGLMGFFAIFIILFYFHDTLPAEKRISLDIKKLTQNYCLCFKDPFFWTYAISSGMCLSLLFGYIAMGSFIYQVQLGLTSVQYGWLSLFSIICVPFGALMSFFFVVKNGVEAIIRVGVAFMLIGALCMLVLGLSGFLNLLAILLPMGLVYIGIGLMFGNLLSAAFEKVGHMAGVASAAYSSIQAFCIFFMTLLAAHLPEHNQVPMASYLLFGASIILCCALMRKALSR